MTLVSLADCCRLLVIDAKTLRRWLNLAHMPVQPHPRDARCKCVTAEQLQQLAATHHRALPLSRGAEMQPETPVPLTSGECPSVERDVPSDCSAHSIDLTKQLGSLQAHIAALEHPLILLREQLQQEQQWRLRQAEVFQDMSLQSSQDRSLQVSQDKSLQSSQDKSLESSQDKSPQSHQKQSLEISQDMSLQSSQGKSLKSHPVQSLQVSQDKSAGFERGIDRRKHKRVLPLVEYGVEGKYVIICPEQGKLEFEPDSPEWFAWLSTLPSFRFTGQHGRFTAFRGYQCSPTTPWWAHRQIRNHSHKRRLGVTLAVSIESLEMAAASLQALA